MAVRVDVASVARVYPAIFEGLCGGLRILVIAQEDPGAPREHFPLRADFYFYLRYGSTHRIRPYFPVGLHANEHARLRHPIELLHVDAERAVKGKNLRSNRLPSSIRQANASQPQVVFEGTIDEPMAQGIQQGSAQPHRLI